MTKRRFLFGTYNTADKHWTLTNWALAPAEVITHFVKVPGRRDGDLDLSTSLTNGAPRFNNRALVATFETSEGTRADRLAWINEMTSQLAGQYLNIYCPDDTDRHLQGRVLTVVTNYCDNAHASVTVNAICAPYKTIDATGEVSL